jgi:hypothetical protein
MASPQHTTPLCLRKAKSTGVFMSPHTYPMKLDPIILLSMKTKEEIKLLIDNKLE